MGNGSSSSSNKAPMSSHEFAERICGNFYVGTMKELYLLGMDIGVLFGKQRMERKLFEVVCLVRESSWVRATPLYKGSLIVSMTSPGIWSGTLFVNYNGPGQGWESIDINQEFSLSWENDCLSGSWKRSESRQSGGASETINTFGNCSMYFGGRVSNQAQKWSPKEHKYYSNPIFRSQVVCLLQLRAQKGTVFHRLPRDLLYLLIQYLSELYPEFHEKFESLMLTEPDGSKITVEELLHRLADAEK